MYCPKCHSEIEDDALFCSECGARLERQEPQSAWQEETQGQNVLRANNTEAGQFYQKAEDTGVRRINSGNNTGKNGGQNNNQNNKRTLFLGLGAVAVVLLVAAAVIITNIILDKRDKQAAENSESVADVAAGTEEDAENLQDDAEKAGDGQAAAGADEDAEDVTDDSEKTPETEETNADENAQTENQEAEGTPIPTLEPLDLGPDAADITAKLLKKAPKDYVRLEVATATSSSELVQEGSDPNNAWMVLDQKDETSWQENVSGPGIGETLNFSFSGEQKIKYMSFKLGNWRNDKYYKGNNIPETLTIRMGELEFSVTFPKKQQEFWVELSEAYPAYDVEVEITSVYEGKSWDDTPIAEIGMYGEK